MLKIGMACICGVLWAGASFSAEVPSMINYQGALVDNEGKPLATGEYTLEFEIYDALTNGALVWGPMVFDGVTAFGHAAKAQVVEGNFNVLLGPIDTSKRPLINAFGGTARYVSIKVHDPVTKAVHTLAPRQQILSVPFALNAQYAATAQTVAAGVVDAAAMADGAALEEISDNDGAGSGLDADTVDGKHASEFMAANKDIWVDAQGDTLTGVLAINGKLAVGRADADTKLHVQGGNWDLISLLQTAEGALTETTNMLQRIRELAVQASNGTNTTDDREAIQAEVDQLIEQINSVARDTEFNGIRPLDPSNTLQTVNTAPVSTTGKLTLQVGLREGQTMQIDLKAGMSGIGGSSAAALPGAGTFTTIADLTTTGVSTQANASEAITAIDSAISYISDLRAQFGAQQNRLEYNLDTLAIQEENSSASDSALRDADIARETTNFTRNQILVSSGTSVLAQSNVIPQTALQLLGQ